MEPNFTGSTTTFTNDRGEKVKVLYAGSSSSVVNSLSLSSPIVSGKDGPVTLNLNTLLSGDSNQLVWAGDNAFNFPTPLFFQIPSSAAAGSAA